MREIWGGEYGGETASRTDIHFLCTFFQGNDAPVGDGFAPLGESHGKRTNTHANKQTSRLLDQSSTRADLVNISLGFQMFSFL